MSRGWRLGISITSAVSTSCPGRMIFAVNAQGEKVATATAFYDIDRGDDGETGWLHWVSVKRSHQGRGLSKPTISRALELLKELGYTRIKIPTQTTSWLACKIYLDFGFLPEPQNALQSLGGWRIIKRLTDHPSLSRVPRCGRLGSIKSAGRKRLTASE